MTGECRDVGVQVVTYALAIMRDVCVYVVLQYREPRRTAFMAEAGRRGVGQTVHSVIFVAEFPLVAVKAVVRPLLVECELLLADVSVQQTRRLVAAAVII